MAGKRPVKGVTHKTGRPTSYTEELGALLCERLMDGESLRSICRDDDMPARSTVLRWLETDDAFRTKCARARELQADALFDEMQEIADTGNPEDVQRAKLRVSTLQWRAAKLSPKKYGDAMQLKHADADGEKLPLGDTDLAAKAAAIMARLALRKLADEGE